MNFFRHIRSKRLLILFPLLMFILLLNCCSNPVSDAPAEQMTGSAVNISETDDGNPSSNNNSGKDTAMNSENTRTYELNDEEKSSFKLSKPNKMYNHVNPVYTQDFGADPYAMEYDGALYLYMTADAFEYDAAGEIIENSYSKIQSINVTSTTDMVNFTACTPIKVAGSSGAAKWAHNSWAPAACWKEIDGKPKFFLYFADNGGGIGVLTADSPLGPFTDPLGHALISRSTPNCSNVLWLFDPAVLVDDDGSAYIYFGGGVPENKAAAPGTGRVAKLGDDMISLASDPIALDVPYLFEDSGIHKHNNKYYYTYCTNWTVDEAGTAKYGISNGQIACLESDSPMGPFTFKQKVLDNPGTVFGLWGNNHHCIFNFKGSWYITYHARTLEKSMKIEHGYRSTHIEPVEITDDGTISNIVMSYTTRSQLDYVNPYESNSAVTVSQISGASVRETDIPAYGCTCLTDIKAGDFVEIMGVDFGADASVHSSATLTLPALCENDDTPVLFDFVLDNPLSEPFARIAIDSFSRIGSSDGCPEYSGKLLKNPEGIHNLFIVCRRGENAELSGWQIK